jgi:hypothetical protein
VRSDIQHFLAFAARAMRNLLMTTLAAARAGLKLAAR